MKDINELAAEIEHAAQLAKEQDEVHRSTDWTNGIPESVQEYHDLWCTWCGKSYTFQTSKGAHGDRLAERRRFCSDECSTAHHNKLKNTNDPDQIAITEYLARNPVRKW